MITIRHSVETIFFITFATALVLFVMVNRNNNKNSPVFSAVIPAVVTPFPTEIPVGPKISIMDSPEGSKTLTLESLENQGQTTYSLFISSKSEEQKQQIFTRQENNSQSLVIPFNTWSPDNTYVFLKEITPTSNDYLVFQNDAPPLSIQDLFAKKVPNYVIEDVTGWAAPNLLIINTKQIDGDSKVSFWFDVPSQSFIQLGTYFK